MLTNETNGAKPKLPPTQLVKAVSRVRDGLSWLHKKLVPPPVALLDMISGSWITQSLGVVAKLGVADQIPPSGAEASEIASKVGAHPESLYRILRALSVVGVFQELDGKRFRLTTIGECLKTDHPQSMRHVAIFQAQLNWPHWGELEHCVRTGTNAVEKVLGEKPFEHLAKHPEKAEVFDKAMTNISKMEVEAILAVYDFSSYRVIADVGGGHGAFLSAVLKAHPRSQGILFDLPHVVEAARSHVRAAGTADRIRIEGGSFFDTVPEGANAYVMKHIIHDWSDAESIRILKNIRAKIPSQGKLLLVEAVIPAPNVPDFSKFLDIEMLVVTTGKERTREEYAELLSRAGFKLERIVPTASLANVIEASPASERPL